jgi:hypothetical protein
LLHELSYDFGDVLFDFNELKFGIQVFTFENVYGLEKSKCRVESGTESFSANCGSLTWAGGQETVDGNVCINACIRDGKTIIKVDAKAPKNIRSVKLLLKNMPYGAVINLVDSTPREVPVQGMILKYPEGWRTLATPLLIMKTDSGKLIYFRSLDTRVRDKKFALLRRGDTIDVELIYEEDATQMMDSVSVPEWEIGSCNTIDEIYKLQMEHIEKAYGLEKWEDRKDVPGWAREISLVAAIHCQHWTGYVFNDYMKVLDSMKWLAEKIDPKRVLAYLPGWEGRYYWKYGNYCPDDRMGGEKGFEKLIQGARDLGVRTMPMFGINIANKGLENFEEWGAPSEFRSASGNRHETSVDWDASRHYDHGSNVCLNPAAPRWQNRLVSQITNLIDRYGFDAVFLDIAAVWVNDPNHYVYDGVVKLVERIREGRPNILVSGEAWYDGLSAATPLIQSGHSDGVIHWYDEVYPDIFDKYCRAFAHLCLGDPGRGSTGVHELGFNPIKRTPVRKGIIPTVTIVENTLQKAPDAVNEIIKDAIQYAELFLQK